MTVEAAIKLHDGMSGVFSAIAAQADSARNAVSGFQQQVSKTSTAVSNRAAEEMNQQTEAAHRVTEQVNQTAAAVEKGNVPAQKQEQTYQKTAKYVQESANQQKKFNSNLESGSNAASNLMNHIKTLAGAYIGMQGIKSLVGLSDQNTSTNARLKLVVDDGGSVTALEKKIRESALRSRADYFDTAQSMAKLQMNSGNVFKGNNETIAFLEQVNKQFAIGGASAQEQSYAMTQLTQAMASGTLRGQDLHSVLEEAPMLARTIEKYMKIPTGSIKQYAEQGKVTASIVKNAVLSATDEVNAKFNSMPMTFSQIMTNLKTLAIEQMQPVLQKLNTIFNSQQFKNMLAQLIQMLPGLVQGLVDILSVVAQIGGFISQNWGTIAPMVSSIAAVFGVWTVATKLQEFFTNKLNLTMLKSPVFWIAAAIAVVLGLLLQGINYVGGLNNALKVCSLVFGLVADWATYAGMQIFNFAATAWDNIQTFAENFKFCWQALGATMVNTAVDAFALVMQFFQDMINGILTPFNAVLDQINKATGKNYHLQVNFGDNAKDWAEKVKQSTQGALDATGAQNAANRATRDKEALQRQNNIGAQWSKVEKDTKKIGDTVSTMHNAVTKNTQSIADQIGGGTSAVANIAQDTKSLASSTDSNKENLKYLRELAERETVNKLTTANVTVKMGGVTQNLASDMDVDGTINALSDSIFSAAISSAEGVHKA